jgi:hypothetical protein
MFADHIDCVGMLQDGVVYHGISPDILMLDRKGQVKVSTT